jgi:hypothetical protein
MRRITDFPIIAGLLLLLAGFVLFTAAPSAAQDDPNEIPLGDVARNLRKQSLPPQPVVDDDNLSSVIAHGESRRSFGSTVQALMNGWRKSFQVGAPAVSCSLSFSANVKSLLSAGRYAQLNLPPDEMVKLQGPATMDGNALTVSVFNGTDWHVSELAVALTIVKETADVLPDGSPGFAPAVADNPIDPSEISSEKKPDMTVIYRMRAAAAPGSTTVFSAPVNENINPGDEWHWAIVQAKGYPPESYRASDTAATANQEIPVTPIMPAALLSPEHATVSSATSESSAAAPQ